MKTKKENKLLINLIFVFFSASFIGWFWEGLIQVHRRGIFINRGFLTGPILPLYGAGAIIAVLVSLKYRKKPIIQFILIMLIASILEYFTSLTLESIFHIRWWSYFHYPFNLNGRICLRGALFFGALGTFYIYLIYPLITKLTNKLNYKVAIVICTILTILISIDTIHSVYIPRVGKGIAVVPKK